jgi:hypothetical protein
MQRQIDHHAHHNRSHHRLTSTRLPEKPRHTSQRRNGCALRTTLHPPGQLPGLAGNENSERATTVITAMTNKMLSLNGSAKATTAVTHAAQVTPQLPARLACCASLSVSSAPGYGYRRMNWT